jgi:hypothetical protein
MILGLWASQLAIVSSTRPLASIFTLLYTVSVLSSSLFQYCRHGMLVTDYYYTTLQ